MYAIRSYYDAPGNADVIDGRHIHQMPSGQGNMRSDPGALGAEGLFGHLHEDILPFLQQILDGGQRRPLRFGIVIRFGMGAAPFDELFHLV